MYVSVYIGYEIFRDFLYREPDAYFGYPGILRFRLCQGFKDKKVNHQLYYLYGKKPYNIEIESIKSGNFIKY